MNITKQTSGSTVTIALEGWLDTTTAPELEKELEGLENITALIFDFEGLEYISSAGLRQVLSAYRKMGDGSFKIINTRPEIMEIFQMTGFDTKLDIQ